MKNSLIPRWQALGLISERGRRLTRMHTARGVRWFLIPDGEVTSETARAIRNMPNVVGSKDGLFPQMDQTWRVQKSENVYD